MTPQTWWYMQQLKRKQAALESDRDRVEALLKRPSIDRNARNRLKLELDCINIRLTKIRRGILY